MLEHYILSDEGLCKLHGVVKENLLVLDSMHQKQLGIFETGKVSPAYDAVLVKVLVSQIRAQISLGHVSGY